MAARDWWLLLLPLAALVFAPVAYAQRVALLIGNSSYQTAPLRNPPNDVREMESALTAIGFKVQKVLNANQNQMKRAVRDFGALAQGAEVAFLYYSGHGIQAGGENYLLPIGANIDKEADYEVEAVSANALMRQIAGARPRAAIVVLDACRDNPYASATKSTSKGLSRMDAPTGTMIAFATSPNNTASDEGFYARALAARIKTPGAELLDVFRGTTADVRRLSGGRQEPRISEMSISEKIYLAGSVPSLSSPVLQLASVKPEPQVRTTHGDPEDEAWQATKGANTPAAFDAYLSEFPNGKYASAARISRGAYQRVAPESPANTSTPSTPPTPQGGANPGDQGMPELFRLLGGALAKEAGVQAQQVRIGVQIDAVPKEVAESIGMDKPFGAMVREVESGSAAENAGVMAGDIITWFNGKAIEKPVDLPPVVAATKPGTPVPLRIFRRGTLFNLIVTIGTGVQSVASASREAGVDALEKVYGLTVAELTDAQRSDANIKEGVRVLRVAGPAVKTGLLEGDIVLAMDDKKTGSLSEYVAVVSTLDMTKRLSMLVRRGALALFKIVQPEVP